MMIPEFTAEQMNWLREMLTPHCCHTTGCHNPVHFQVDAGDVCDLQRAEAYDRLIEILGLQSSLSAVSDPSCSCCLTARQEAGWERDLEAIVPLAQTVAEVVGHALAGTYTPTAHGHLNGARWRLDCNDQVASEYRGCLRITVKKPEFDPTKPIPENGYPAGRVGITAEEKSVVLDAIKGCGAIIIGDWGGGDWISVAFRGETK